MSSDHSQKLLALLFVHGDPISITELATMLAIDELTLETTIKQVEELLASMPFFLTRGREGIGLATRPEHGDFLKNIKKSITQTPLSKPALEVLVIIMYKGGATKSYIDSIRGVNSALSLRNLIIRGIIERSEEGGTTVYKATNDTFAHLGIESLTQLPDYERFISTIENTTTELSAEGN